MGNARWIKFMGAAALFFGGLGLGGPASKRASQGSPFQGPGSQEGSSLDQLQEGQEDPQVP
jgi:hypothetical protein